MLAQIGKIENKTQYVIFAFALLKIVIHFAANANYGLHADELYYIALSQKLQWGYLDNSPLIAVIAKASSFCFGTSTFAWRVFPTIFSALTVALTGYTVHYMGGKRVAVIVACMGIICSPAYLATSYFLQPVVFDQFFWTGLVFSVIRYVQSQKTKFLYAAALCTSFGMLNKYTVLLYVVAIILGLLITKQRKQLPLGKLFKPALLCLLLVLPNLIWQFAHHFPIFSYLRIVNSHTAYPGIGNFLFQLCFFHGMGIIVWLAGLGYLLFSTAQINNYRFAGISFLLTVLLLLVLQGKIYYNLGAYPVLFAAGGIYWETLTGRFWRVVQYSMLSVLLLTSLIALPIVVPVLPFQTVKTYIGLMRRYTSITQPFRWEDGKTHELPQFYADMLGWKELTAQTEKACAMLDARQRRGAVILTESYAVTGALKYYLKDKAPAIVSAHNSFMMWSPDTLNAPCIIYLSRENSDQVAQLAKVVSLVGTVQNTEGSINGMKIYLLQGPSGVLQHRYQAARKEFMASD